ncbi:hypothetical protein C8Q74DRAFT_1372661 [Fomes fomentarius]|nr:hypothetical protein C8Q74DRAFT_1372661 [Fomes fomentarius]
MAPSRTTKHRGSKSSTNSSSSSSTSKPTTRRNPAYWEGDQHLLEMTDSDDPTKPGRRLTEAAEKAQKQRWRRLMANRPPRKNISPKLLARKGRKPPLLYYGWPFMDYDMILYAKRHSLSYRPSATTRANLGCGEHFNFANLTEEHLRNPQVVRALRTIAFRLAQHDLIGKTAARLTIGRPFSSDWDSILVLWTNYNMEEHYPMLEFLGIYDNVVATLDEELNVGKKRAERTKLRWWWSWDNDVSIFTDIN